MIRKNIKLGSLLAGVLLLAAYGCSKKERPALGEYTEDYTTTPTTDLRFFADFDSADASAKQINIRFEDKISGYPSFFPNKAITVIDGVKGTAFQGASGYAVQYLNANDFSSSTSFTVALWEKNSVPDGGKAQFAFGLPDKDYWSTHAMFLLFDHTGSGATTDSAVVKFYINDDNGDHWFEMTGANRMPHIYDGEWHHLAFAYDQTTSQMSIYRDGALFKTFDWTGHGPITLKPASVKYFILGGANKHVGLAAPYDGLKDDWVESWKGGLDQFRLYNKALTAAEINALFTNRE